jgi:hypothetical protein
MARPSIVRTKDGGEITLKNCDPSLREKIKTLVEGGSVATASEVPRVEVKSVAPAAPANVESASANTPQSTGDLTHFAIGNYKGKDGWYAVQVKYNPTTGSAAVVTNEKVGVDKVYAEERFKLLAVDHDLV